MAYVLKFWKGKKDPLQVISVNYLATNHADVNSSELLILKAKPSKCPVITLTHKNVNSYYVPAGIKKRDFFNTIGPHL